MMSRCGGMVMKIFVDANGNEEMFVDIISSVDVGLSTCATVLTMELSWHFL